jgi:FMN phosphatase YigB (HAD superfamily)
MPELVACRSQDLEALRRLRAADWRIGIVTNGMTDNQHGKIHRAGLHTMVDGWCISDEVGIRKPKAAIFDIIAQRCGTSLAQGGWMIGDDPLLDIAGGRRAGLRTISLQRESTLWPEDQPAPDNTVATVADAVEILLQAS